MPKPRLNPARSGHAHSRQTKIVNFRLDLQTYAKMMAAIESETSSAFTVSEYCQAVITRWVWRHDRSAVYNPDTKRVERTLQPVRPTKRTEGRQRRMRLIEPPELP